MESIGLRYDSLHGLLGYYPYWKTCEWNGSIYLFNHLTMPVLEGTVVRLMMRSENLIELRVNVQRLH